MLSDQVVTTKSGCLAFQNNASAIILPIQIDNQKSDFLFDTGATISCLIDSTVIENFSNKKFGTLASAKGADRKKVKVKFMTAAMHSSLFDSENKVLSYIEMPKSNCNKSKKSYSGIIGLDPFFENDMSLLLDFSNGKVCNLSKAGMENLLKEDQFQTIKSECKNNQVFVFLTIDGKVFKFKLDTGFSGNIIIPFSDNLDFSKYNTMTLEGSYYQTINASTKGLENFHENVPVQIGASNVMTKVCVSNTIKAQNIGMTLIRCYDWLIDYNHNKVYIKPNANKIESTFNRRISYLAMATDKLRIVTKEKFQTKYNLGDEITTVNGQKVTTANNCELQDFLNKTDDWSTLQLTIIPGSP